MRMPFFAELRWLIAQVLLDWVVSLTANEASDEMVAAYFDLTQNFAPDPKFNTVKMRQARR